MHFVGYVFEQLWGDNEDARAPRRRRDRAVQTPREGRPRHRSQTPAGNSGQVRR